MSKIYKLLRMCTEDIEYLSIWDRKTFWFRLLELFEKFQFFYILLEYTTGYSVTLEF